MNHLLHPEALDGGTYLVGQKITDTLQKTAAETAEQIGDTQFRGVTVAVRTLNEADALERLLQDVQLQESIVDPQIVVVDNESSDGTTDVARYYGAEVVTLPRGEFSYARSMNLAMEAADNPLVFLTVGHAALATNVSLAAGAHAFRKDSKLAGAYGIALSDVNASRTEKALNIGTLGLMQPQKITKKSMGVLAATGAMIDKGVWESLDGFDERFQRGGEDTQLAGKMLETGYNIQRLSLLSVHHTHGLGPINYARQFLAWMQMAGGKDMKSFDVQQIAARRPDLDFS